MDVDALVIGGSLALLPFYIWLWGLVGVWDPHMKSISMRWMTFLIVWGMAWPVGWVIAHPPAGGLLLATWSIGLLVLFPVYALAAVGATLYLIMGKDFK